MKIPIVNEQDEIIRYEDWETRNPKDICRVAALWVLNEKKEFLLAKRSKNKKHHPSIWGPSVAGSVEENETYQENIIKEAEEEIGIEISKIMLGPKKRISSSHEYFCQYFFTQVPSKTKFILQESEVDEVRWVSLEKLKDWCSKTPEEFIPTFKKNLDIIENYDNQS